MLQQLKDEGGDVGRSQFSAVSGLPTNPYQYDRLFSYSLLKRRYTVKSKLFLTVITLVVAVGLVFTGCSSGKGGDSQQTAGQEGTAKSAESTGAKDSGKQVELRFMDVIPNPDRDAKFQEVIERFNKENPGVKATLETVPWDQAHQKLVTLGSAGSMPDVFVMHQQWNSEFINAKWVAKLDDYLDKYEHKDDIIPYVRNVLMDYDHKQTYGGIYGIPDGLTTHGMFVRTDWVKEIGMELKDLETWDGIFEAAEKMTDPSKNRYGFSYRGGRAGGEQLGMYVYSELGGHLYDKDGNCLFNTPKGIEAFKRYTDLYKKGYAPKDSINWGYAEMVQGFTSGLTGILNQTTEVVAECNKTMDKDTWTVLPFPKGKDGKIYSKADSFYLSIAANSKNPDEAWKLIAYMVKPEINREICKVNLYIPVMKGAENDPDFTEGPMSGFLRSMNDPGFVRNPYYGYFPEVGEFTESFQDSEIQKYLLGKQSIEQTVKNISDYLTKYQQKFMKENPDVPIPDCVSIN